MAAEAYPGKSGPFLLDRSAADAGISGIPVHAVTAAAVCVSGAGLSRAVQAD
ncbi:hypothetical protein D3C71_2172750 [compost metagenome]